MRVKKILVIGCGSIGERHLRCFLATQRIEAIACDSNIELLKHVASKYNVDFFDDFRKAFSAMRPEAVVICTPAPFHVPMAIAALEAGCHVLVEKPLSASLDGVGELLSARQKHARQVAVAYVYRVFPMLVQAQAFLADNPLGRIRQVVVSSGQPFYLLRKGYEKTYYRDRAMGGGAIQDALTHFANWVEGLIGPTDSVLCDCAHQVVPGVDVEDTVHISARHGDILTSYSLNQFQAANESSFQINAVQGSVRIELHNQRWGVIRHGETAWTWHDASVTDRDAHFTAQANAFLDQIEGKPTVSAPGISGAPARLCSLDEAVQTLRFNLAALRSAEQGMRIHCRDTHE